MGLPEALDALHERVAAGRLVAAASGYLAGSASRLPAAPPGPWSRFGLAVARAGPDQPRCPPPLAEAFAGGLLDLHRDELARTLDLALHHLGGRSSGGTTLLGKQLVQGQLAECALDISEDEAMPAQRRSADSPSRWRAHQRLVRTGRRLLRLLGARGFLAEGPAVSLYLAELVGNLYLHPYEHPDEHPYQHPATAGG